jgi:hypothetical protein
MHTAISLTHVGALSAAIIAMASAAGCAASGATKPPAASGISTSRHVAHVGQTQARAPGRIPSVTPVARGGPVLSPVFAVGQADAPPPRLVELPCGLLIRKDPASITLEFHAQYAPLESVRNEVKELELYFNENRGDLAAAAAPDGRPEPTTFALRTILEASPVATSADLPDGARLTLTPSKMQHLRLLQARVLWYAADLLPGLPLTGKACPVLPKQLEVQPQASAVH